MSGPFGFNVLVGGRLLFRADDGLAALSTVSKRDLFIPAPPMLTLFAQVQLDGPHLLFFFAWF